MRSVSCIASIRLSSRPFWGLLSRIPVGTCVRSVPGSVIAWCEHAISLKDGPTATFPGPRKIMPLELPTARWTSAVSPWPVLREIAVPSALV